jgi:hypothetical protein
MQPTFRRNIASIFRVKEKIPARTSKYAGGKQNDPEDGGDMFL